MDRASIHLRLPRDLHDECVRKAEEQGVSLNTLLAAIVSGSLGWNLRKPRRRAA